MAPVNDLVGYLDKVSTVMKTLRLLMKTFGTAIMYFIILLHSYHDDRGSLDYKVIIIILLSLI